MSLLGNLLVKAAKPVVSAGLVALFAVLSPVSSWGDVPLAPLPVLHVPYTPPLLTGTPEDPAWKAAAVIPSLAISLGQPRGG